MKDFAKILIILTLYRYYEECTISTTSPGEKYSDA